ncbi:ABC transporter C family member 8-like protein isoform X1 [Tanacetum coccineum]
MSGERVFCLISLHYFPIILLLLASHLRVRTRVVVVDLCAVGGRPILLSVPLLVDETLEDQPSFLSKLTFSWVNPLLSTGQQKPLVVDDIPSLASSDQGSVAHEKFTKAFELLKTTSSNDINLVLKTLRKVYFQEMFFSGLCVFLRTIAIIASPLLLYAFVKYTNSDIKDLNQGLMLVACLIVVKVVESLSHRQFFFNARRTGMRMRSALMVAMSVHGYTDDEYEYESDGDNVTLISKLDVSSPLHLHPNDSTTLTVVSVKLKGTENYQVWSCAMLLALEGKNKTGFIDGSCRRSNTDEILGKQWDRVNAVVLGWILNSISEELFLGQIFSKRAKHVWDELKDTYDKVDGSVTHLVLQDCVMTCLEEKTVILVTHQMEFLSSVDNILVMKGGQVEQSGHYEDLLMAGTALEQLVNAHKDAITCLDSSVHKTVNMHQRQEDANKINLGKENNETKGITGMQLTEDEEKEIGSVGWKSFWDYIIISEGSVFFYLCLLTHASFVALQAGATYWLAFGNQIPKVTNITLIGVYTLVSTTSVLFAFLRSVFVTVLGLKASKSFFNNFTNSVFNAPMAFFDSTPVGEFLTRVRVSLKLKKGIELLVTIGVMASVPGQVLIVIILATLAIKYAHGYYEPTARELMRINGTTKAPVMNYASETSLGVATIRAFNMQERFFKDYLKLVDTDARLVGLSLSYALVLTSTQVFFTRWYCSLANYIVSVERIKQFMNTPPEPPKIIENNRPSSSWPSKGRIDFEDLKLRYRSNAPLVLKGINCTFKEGTRVGIVGRTGSGKTTLITALFRLVEPHSGRIIIDG